MIDVIAIVGTTVLVFIVQQICAAVRDKLCSRGRAKKYERKRK